MADLVWCCCYPRTPAQAWIQRSFFNGKMTRMLFFKRISLGAVGLH
ncbi:hypothetical protein BDA96_03G200200 [Sorghum bicolor]|uniref:Uncharacterized protein n=2 Tax=Sorghum bicolor TaxID=4558 RepID=A0A921RDY1_SORBI|nr:hypothetical protein BDA96_03G200200 [Sorghum bicolor]OQU86990.1 hypothetical protein SORBI_3003G184699 [Sorghum bicolor]